MFSDVSFNLMMNQSSVYDDLQEGVEFSFRSSTEGEWIPLKFFAVSSNIPDLIELPDDQQLNNNDYHIMLRGYTIPYVIQSGNNTKYNVSVCVKDDHVKLQFRWLNTAHHTKLTRDVVILDDVTVIAHNCTHNITLLEDNNFDNKSQTHK